MNEEIIPERVGKDSPVWLFPGSNSAHSWIEAVRKAYSEEEEEEGEELESVVVEEIVETKVILETVIQVEVASGSRGRTEEEEDGVNKKSRVS